MRAKSRVAPAYETVEVSTSDGFALSLFHSAPPLGTPAPRAARPVLLLPGANANHLGFGLDAATSLPAALNAAGLDAWLLDFRGSRSSRYLGEGRAPIDLDRKLVHDLPAALRVVTERTGSRRVDLVGHSLGGLLALLHCGRPDTRDVGRLVVVATPTTFRHHLGPLTRLAAPPVRALAPMAARLPGLAIDRLARFPGPARHLVALHRHVRWRTTDRHARRAWLEGGIEDMAGGDLAQLMRWIGHGRLLAVDGEDYDLRLGAVTAPTLVITAAGDRFLPASSTRETLARIGSVEKEHRVIGVAHGAAYEYGHSDILLSPHAAKDVHPHIVDWLRRSLPGAAPDADAVDEAVTG
ncbi:MAG: alpha/beta fold hydrolase [Deltaproteobacteria bacterium]|nr:alpha/beta fold hydrolase [Deltaproteobacteria bacterium]